MRFLRTLLQTLPMAVALLCSPRAAAHRPSDAWLQLGVTNRSVTLQLDLALRDLEPVLGIDTRDDGNLSWDALRRREPDLDDYITRHLTLTNASGRLLLVPEPLRLVNHEEVVCVSLRFTAEAPGPLERLTLTYRCLFELDPQHRALVNAHWSGATVAGVPGPGTTGRLLAEDFTGLLSPTAPSVTFEAPTSTPEGPTSGSGKGFLPFLGEGVHHIATGYDHLLFLAALLLPAVLRRSPAGWEPCATLGVAARQVLQVVTAFTVGHSATLALAVLGIARPPSRLIESAIAASVVHVALRNLRGRDAGGGPDPASRTAWTRAMVLPFGFGLVHGFGFANALGELGLHGRALVLPLVGFNLGVEAGQVAAVTLFLPAAFVLRRTHAYRRVALPGTSLLIALVALAWLVDRAFAIGFMPF